MSTFDKNATAPAWPSDRLGKGSQVLLEAVSLLDPEAIPEYILEENVAAHTWPGYPSTSVEYQQARTELIERSLITLRRGKKIITVNRLIQDAVRARMTDEAFSNAFASMLSFISNVWPYEQFSFGDKIFQWDRCKELFLHVLKLQSLFSRFKLPTSLTKDLLNGPKLFIDSASKSNMWGLFEYTIPLLYLAEQMCDAFGDEKNQDQDLSEELATLRHTIIYERGIRALHTNDLNVSLVNLKKFNQIVRDRYGDNVGGTDQTLGVSWNELGNAYLQNDNSFEAEKCFLESIRCLEALDGATRISISMPLINLGFAAWVQGRLTEADRNFAQALADREKEYGSNDKVSFVTGKLLLGYGNVKLAQGELDYSFMLHQSCLKQYKSTVGNNHHRTADACVKVSSHYVRLEKFDLAIVLLDQAIRIYTAGGHLSFIAEHTRARRNRGMLFQQIGKLSEAQADLDVAEELWKEMCPDDEREFDNLQDEDFDHRIMFWSR